MSNQIRNSITVAVNEKKPGMEYRGFDTHTKAIIFTESFEAGNLHTGNFLAIVHALRLLKRNNVKTDAIYSDSVKAILWVKEKTYPNTVRSGKKREKLKAAITEAREWLEKNDCTVKLLRWDTENWGNVVSYSSPEHKNGSNQKHLKINT